MKQTAVEWLVDMLIDNKYLLKDAEHLFNHAKQMEKEQIINAVYYECSAMSHSDLPCGEEYYQKTFKSE
jgi:hypothetical protein